MNKEDIEHNIRIDTVKLEAVRELGLEAMVVGEIYEHLHRIDVLERQIRLNKELLTRI